MTKLIKNNFNKCLLPTSTIKQFVEWKKNLNSEIRGSKLMYDVPRHYKWLEENELLNYFISYIYCCG